jgi:hypothetical protein
MSSCTALFLSGYLIIAVGGTAVDAKVVASCLVNLGRLLSLDWQRRRGQSVVRASPVHQGLHTFETLADCLLIFLGSRTY